MRQILQHISSVNDEEFEQMYKAISIPADNKYKEMINTEKKLAYENLSDVQEFEQFKKLQELEFEQSEAYKDLINKFNFDTKSLGRLLLFYITAYGHTVIEQRLANSQIYPMLESASIVRRLFGFDMNWLIGMSLIQLHENMIKKKYSQLGGVIKERQPIQDILTNLGDLIKTKEGRNVILSLDKSYGLKQIRNRLTHEGFKHAISSEDLKTLLHDVKQLEQILFPKISS